MTAIQETISEKKRGRPMGSQRQALDDMTDLNSGCLRTKVNEVFMFELLGLVEDATEDVQRIVWGCTKSEIASGTANFPRGWKTFAPEIGRYLSIADDDEKQNSLNVIVDARQRGLSWSDIGAHFRTCRLGEREGNPGALSLAINRAINDFKKRFPKTSEDDIFECLRDVLNHRNEAGADSK